MIYARSCSRAFCLARAGLEALKLMAGIPKTQAEQIQRLPQSSYPSKVGAHATAMVQSTVGEMQSLADHALGRDNMMPSADAWFGHDQPVGIQIVLPPELPDPHFEHPQKGRKCYTHTHPAGSHNIAAPMQAAGGSKSTKDHKHQDNNAPEAPQPPVGTAETGVRAIAGLGIDQVARPVEGVGDAAPPMDCLVR